MRFWPTLALALGCSGGDETDAIIEPPVRECAAGEWQRGDGVCVAAGLPPDMPCPPGEWLRDGVCIPAGVPPDGCAEGFVHDGREGCGPVLPSEACAPGLMAIPGETTCREVAPCAAGTWGDIPVDADTEYVDASYTGMDSDGSALKPWLTVQDGIDAASAGAVVAIAQGSYAEDLVVVGKPVRLWGVCPARVEIVGSSTGLAAVQVRNGADGTETHGLAIRGGGRGFITSGSLDVLLEQTHVHDTGHFAIAVENTLGQASVTLVASLVEQSGSTAVYVYGADATIQESVIRDAQFNAEGLFGRGLGAESKDGTASSVVMRSSLIERTHDVGVHADGSAITIEASVIRDTLPDADGYFGRGVNARADDSGAASTLVVSGSVVAQTGDVGVFVEGSDVTVENSVIRDTHFDATGIGGWGLSAQLSPLTAAPSTLLLRSSLLAMNADVGVFVHGSHATVEASVVRDTQPNATGINGRGMSVQLDPVTATTSTLLAQSSVFAHNHELGVFVSGAEATLEASVIRDTEKGRGMSAQYEPITGTNAVVLLRSSLVENSGEIGVYVAGSDGTIETSVVRATRLDADGLGGRAVHGQTYGVGSTLVLKSSLLEDSFEAGVAVFSSTATIDACIIRNTQPSPEWGTGDGVMVASADGLAGATITNTRIHQSALAAVAAWGAGVSIGASALSCQAIDLNGESYFERAAALVDLGGNTCGCPEPVSACKALSTALGPPPPPLPVDD